jgi:hypothetical protein
MVWGRPYLFSILTYTYVASQQEWHPACDTFVCRLGNGLKVPSETGAIVLTTFRLFAAVQLDQEMSAVG